MWAVQRRGSGSKARAEHGRLPLWHLHCRAEEIEAVRVGMAFYLDALPATLVDDLISALLCSVGLLLGCPPFVGHDFTVGRAVVAVGTAMEAEQTELLRRELRQPVAAGHAFGHLTRNRRLRFWTKNFLLQTPHCAYFFRDDKHITATTAGMLSSRRKGAALCFKEIREDSTSWSQRHRPYLVIVR